MPTENFADRSFADDKQQAIDAINRVPGFNPGGDGGVVRQVDGHNPYEVGMEGSNVHRMGAGSPEWDDPVGVKVEDD